MGMDVGCLNTGLLHYVACFNTWPASIRSLLQYVACLNTWPASLRGQLEHVAPSTRGMLQHDACLNVSAASMRGLLQRVACFNSWPASMCRWIQGVTCSSAWPFQWVTQFSAWSASTSAFQHEACLIARTRMTQCADTWCSRWESNCVVAESTDGLERKKNAYAILW